MRPVSGQDTRADSSELIDDDLVDHQISRRDRRLVPSVPLTPSSRYPLTGQNTTSASNLAVKSRRLSETCLKVLQNECGVHLAPSEVERFGHSIGEALSCGAILITSNAPPMKRSGGLEWRVSC